MYQWSAPSDPPPRGMRGTLRAAGALLLLLALFSWPALAVETYTPEQVVVSLNPGFGIDEVNGRWGTVTVDAFVEGNLYLLWAQGETNCEALALQMALDPAVAEAEANYYQDTAEGIRQMVIVAVGGNLGDYEDQALTQRIGVAQAHQMSLGLGVKVAVLDTGLDSSHEAFTSIAADGYDFVDDDAQPVEEADGLDNDGDGMTDDGYGHGTMVAGIVSLVAPASTLLPVRVLDDEGRGEAFRIAKAIRYAVDHGADVINMSFGVPRTISVIGTQLTYAALQGVILVAGAGNTNSDNPVYYPGADSKSILITALDSLDVKADFADWNSKVHVSAPGTGVRSPYPGGGWGIGSGCSFATPFVSGEAALLLSLAPGLTKEQVEDRIETAVQPIYQIPGNAPYDGKLGSGRIYLPLVFNGLTSDVPEPVERAAGPMLAFPNPAAGSITFRIPAVGGDQAIAKADIYDLAGRRIAPLMAAGRLSFTWDGLDVTGRPVAAGSYFAVVRQGERDYRGSVRIIR